MTAPPLPAEPWDGVPTDAHDALSRASAGSTKVNHMLIELDMMGWTLVSAAEITTLQSEKHALSSVLYQLLNELGCPSTHAEAMHRVATLRRVADAARAWREVGDAFTDSLNAKGTASEIQAERDLNDAERAISDALDALPAQQVRV